MDVQSRTSILFVKVTHHIWQLYFLCCNDVMIPVKLIHNYYKLDFFFFGIMTHIVIITFLPFLFVIHSLIYWACITCGFLCYYCWKNGVSWLVLFRPEVRSDREVGSIPPTLNCWAPPAASLLLLLCQVRPPVNKHWIETHRGGLQVVRSLAL